MKKDFRNLFVICEGLDRCGKSTLIKKLKNYYNDLVLHSLHYSNVKQNSTEEVISHSKRLYNDMFILMKETLKKDKCGLLIDRSHLGELVYGKLYRNYDADYVLDIEKAYKHFINIYNNLYLITLIDEPEHLIERDDGESFTSDLDKKKEEIELFKKAHERSNITNKLFINISGKNEEEVFQEVITFIDKI